MVFDITIQSYKNSSKSLKILFLMGVGYQVSVIVILTSIVNTEGAT